MSKKISKGDVVLAKDLTEDYWGSEIEFEQGPGIKSTMVLNKHHVVYVGELTDLYPAAGETAYFITVGFDTELTILTPPKPNHPEQPTEMGTIIQIEGEPVYTYAVDYYGDILSLTSAKYIPWDDVKRSADVQGSKILISKPTASQDDGLTDIETRYDWLGMVAEPQDKRFPILGTDGGWWRWGYVLSHAGDRQIIVSDPPRWPDETPDAPERIERGEWPGDDRHLREWEWIDRDGDTWAWEDRGNRKSGWNWNPYLVPLSSPIFGPWTRGERVK